MKTKMENGIAETTAKILLDIGAVSFRFNPPYVFTSGIKSPIYLDNRIVMSYPEARRKIVNFYIKLIRQKDDLEQVDYISATATAAVPHGAWIAGKLDLPMVYVRPTTKSYGKGNKVEGYFKKGSRVLIIEDHISTGTSVVNNAQTIREIGGRIEYCVATTTYETEISKKIFTEHKIKLITLTTGRIIVQEAFKRAYLTEEEKKEVYRWLDEPDNWGKK